MSLNGIEGLALFFRSMFPQQLGSPQALSERYLAAQTARAFKLNRPHTHEARAANGANEGSVAGHIDFTPQFADVDVH